MVEVYRNLNKRGAAPVYSIREGGRVVGHSENVWIENATFVVRESGRQRVLREKRKNVHAWVKGKRIAAPAALPRGERSVSYDPYKVGYFYDRASGSSVVQARLVQIGPQGVKVWP